MKYAGIPFYFFVILASLVISFPTQAFDEKEKKEIENVIHQYLLENPQILEEMQQSYRNQQRTRLVEKQQKTLQEKAGAIFSSKYQAEAGNSGAKYTVVEFFDYNCSFCQRALEDMKKILEKNPDVKFVLKEWPVLGDDSYNAHKVSIAFNALNPEKYIEFHKRLLELKINRRKGEKEAMAIAKSLGVKEKALREEMKKQHVSKTLLENQELASELGITGTPSYVIGNTVVFGAVGADRLDSHIQKLKKM